jgi:mannosyl-oligosaccharide alpha-1,2-mannosidase
VFTFTSCVADAEGNRPEAIESVFIMYRITGDKTLQDAAWRMFRSIEKLSRTDIAHAGIVDVRTINTAKFDKMESFWLAETLKYFYLIFSEPSLVSLDEYVL